MNPIVIDSNMWILACATNQEDSDLDQQAAKHARHGDTDKIRGYIFRQLMDRETVIPERVVAEIEDFKNSWKAGPHNKALLKRLTKIFSPRMMRVCPTCKDLIRQAALFNHLKESPKTSKEYRAYEKIRSWEAQVGKAKALAEDLQKAGKRGRWQELADEINHLTRTFEQHPETSKIRIEKEKAYAKAKPFLLPDYEIMLCAERTGGGVCSRDADIAAWHEASPSFKQSCGHPIEPFFADADLETKFPQLDKKLQEKTKDKSGEITI